MSAPSAFTADFQGQALESLFSRTRPLPMNIAFTNRYCYDYPIMKLKRKKLFNTILKRFRKSPIPIVVGFLVLFGLLGGATYGTYYYKTVNSQKNNEAKTVAKVDAKTDSLKADITEIDTKKDTTETPKKASETKIDYSDPRAPTLETGAGCAGAACYAPASFSIVATPSVVSLQAGKNSGPILIKTTDGSSVDWGGMPGDGGVGSYANTAPGHSASFVYYVSANEKTGGTYHLTFYARKESPTRQQATVTVTVKVTPAPYFTINIGTASLTYLAALNRRDLSIPFVINRYNGGSGAISASGTVTCPNNYAKTFYDTWTTNPATVNLANMTLFSLPGTCTIKQNFSDSYGNTITDTVSFKVQ